VLNLVGTRIDRNLLRVRDGKSHRYELLFAPEEVKNSVELSMPLPAWVASLIDRYRSDGRRALGQGANAWLFPGMTDRHMSTQAMTTRIGQITERRLGVRLTAHKFRHVAGAIFLRDNPGHYETVRRLLGHKNLTTTLNFYAGMEQAAATRHYSTAIEARRQVLLQNPALSETLGGRGRARRSA
jgi:integrase